MATYVATIRLPSGGLERITIEASNFDHARQLLELRFGKGKVLNLNQR